MIKLVVFLLLLSVQSFGQSFIFPAVISTPVSTPVDTPAGARTLIYEPFDGTSLDSRWAIRRPEKMTYSVDGGYFKISGRADTVPPVVGYSNYRAKSFQLRMTDTSYGESMMREFDVEFGGIVKKRNDTTLGVFGGAASTWNNYYTDIYACYDYSNNSLDTLIATPIDDTIYRNAPFGLLSNALPSSVSVDDYLRVKLSFRGDTAYASVKNITTGDSARVGIQYDYTNLVALRPLSFYYAFGLMGRTDFWFDYIHVTTDELQHPDIMFIGDSKLSGYFGGKADSNICVMLKPHTTKSLQLWAGPGNTVTNTFNCLKEYRNNYPAEAIILDLGTNSGGTFSDYQRLVDSLSIIAGGIPVYKLLTPNGGNPATPGTWNYNIATTYASTYIDTYTGDGYATMSVGNGLMTDTIHESAAGKRHLAMKIKAALPALFPL